MSIGLLGGSLILGGIASFFAPKPQEAAETSSNKNFSLTTGAAARDSAIPVLVGGLRFSNIPVISYEIRSRDIG